MIADMDPINHQDDPGAIIQTALHERGQGLPRRANKVAANGAFARDFRREKGVENRVRMLLLLAFARILTLNPKILILDEATASLDLATEMILQRGLTRIAGGRTTLVIAHRLSTIRQADVIFVMDQGRGGERGNHEELLGKGGYYAELVNKSAPNADELVEGSV